MKLFPITGDETCACNLPPILAAIYPSCQTEWVMKLSFILSLRLQTLCNINQHYHMESCSVNLEAFHCALWQLRHELIHPHSSTIHFSPSYAIKTKVCKSATPLTKTVVSLNSNPLPTNNQRLCEAKLAIMNCDTLRPHILQPDLTM